jgi:PQQ-like domain
MKMRMQWTVTVSIVIMMVCSAMATSDLSPSSFWPATSANFARTREVPSASGISLSGAPAHLLWKSAASHSGDFSMVASSADQSTWLNLQGNEHLHFATLDGSGSGSFNGRAQFVDATGLVVVFDSASGTLSAHNSSADNRVGWSVRTAGSDVGVVASSAQYNGQRELYYGATAVPVYSPSNHHKFSDTLVWASDRIGQLWNITFEPEYGNDGVLDSFPIGELVVSDDGSKLFVYSQYNDLGTLSATRITCIDLSSAAPSVLWSQSVDYNRVDIHLLYSAQSDVLILVSPGHKVYQSYVKALDASTGDRQWAAPIHDLATYTSPVLASSGRRLIVGFSEEIEGGDEAQQGLLALRISDGSIDWRLSLPHVHPGYEPSSPAIAGDSGLFGADNAFYSFDVSSGTVIQTTELPDYRTGSYSGRGKNSIVAFAPSQRGFGSDAPGTVINTFLYDASATPFFAALSTSS